MNKHLRLFLASLALTSAAGAVGAAELKLANFMSPNHPYEELVFKAYANNVETATNGEVSIRVYSGGELGPGPVEQYNRAVDGVTDIAFGLPGYTASNFPKTLLTELPGVVSETEGTAAVLDNLDMLDKEYRRVKLLGLWNNAPNALFMREKPIRTLSDLEGMKIRVPSRNAGHIVKSWGATPVSMPVPEIYNSMQTGVIDGAFIDGTATFAFKLSEVTKYITTGMNSSISSFFMVMNRDSFNDLSKEHQAALLDEGKKISLIANEIQRGGAKKGLSEFSTADGKELIELGESEVAAFNAASGPVVKQVLDTAESEGISAKAYIEALAGS